MKPDAYICNNYERHPVRVVKKTERSCTVAYLINGAESRFNFRNSVGRYCRSGCVNIYSADYLDFDVVECEKWNVEKDKIHALKNKLCNIEDTARKLRQYKESCLEHEAQINAAHAALCPPKPEQPQP